MEKLGEIQLKQTIIISALIIEALSANQMLKILRSFAIVDSKDFKAHQLKLALKTLILLIIKKKSLELSPANKKYAQLFLNNN